jgi:hypothetical protein
MNERNMIQDIIRPNFLQIESKPGRSSDGHGIAAAPRVKLPPETSRVTFSSGATCDHNCQSGCKPVISYSSSVSSLIWDDHADQVHKGPFLYWSQDQ